MAYVRFYHQRKEVTHQAEFSQESTRREKLKNWKETGVLLAKGARSPRESPNFLQKEENTAQRELHVLIGGEPSKVTHREGARRGSRLRKGETRASRRESRLIEQQEVEDWQAENEAPIIRMDDWKEQHAAKKASSQEDSQDMPVLGQTVQPAEQLPAIQSEGAKPKDTQVWTAADFTEEAVTQDRERWEKNRPTFEEARRGRQNMEAQFEKAIAAKLRLMKALLGRGCKSPQPAKEESEQEVQDHIQHPDCVHHLNFDATARPAPAARPQLQGSHRRPLKRHSRPDRAGDGKG